MQAKSLGDAHFLIKAGGVIADYHASGDMVGAWAADEVVGRNVSDLVPPDTAETILRCIKESLDSNAVVEIDYMFKIKGLERARQASFTPIGGDEGLAVVRDVTERRAEHSLLVHLAEILEASTDFVATTDLTGRAIFGTNVTIGASVGMASSGVDVTPTALLLAADQAAYSAKHAGRGRVVEAAVG